MATEDTPLLSNISAEDLLVAKHNEVYERFSKPQKRAILTLVSLCGLPPLFMSGSIMPVIPDIAKDLNSNATIVSLAISISIFGASIGALFGACYSTYYGRRPIYLIFIPISLTGSFGVATARSIEELLFWRLTQAIGASPAFAVGAGAIGDIFRLEERGQAMGIFFGTVLIGPAIAPLIGGIMARYYSWRVMQYGIGIAQAILFVAVLFAFPETSQPGARGIDKTRASHPEGKSPGFVWLNPLKPWYLLRSPVILMLSLAGTGVLITDYVLLTPLAYTIAPRYNITNQALIGLCYVPIGLGNLLGAPIAGRISDKLVVRYRAKRGGTWYPEDRLRGTLIGAGILVPLSVLFSGLLTQFVPGRIGLALNLLCLFVNGLGVDFMLSPAGAYAVDILHDRSAESMAATNGFRALVMSMFVSAINPMITHFGVAVTNAIAAVLAWIGFVLLWLLIRYGNQLRAYKDIGFSTIATT